MKSPKEFIKPGLPQKPIAQSTPKPARKKRRPTGGKALARLKQFLRERNLSLPPNKRIAQTSVLPALKKSVPIKAVWEKEVYTSKEEEVTIKYAKALGSSCGKVKENKKAKKNAPSFNGKKNKKVIKKVAKAKWKFLGPSSITNGQTYGNSRVIVSGRVAAIAIDPNDSKHILVGSAGGGVWESKDQGKAWIPRTDFEESLKTGAIVFDPSNPSIVYCGTGEGNQGEQLGQGILGSTDGGKSWDMICKHPFVGQDFFDLIVDPADGQHLIAATSEGMYASADRGINWLQKHMGTCWDLAISPAVGPNAEILVACINGLFQSTDGGITYTNVFLPGAQGNYNRLAVTLSKSDPRIAYAFGVQEGEDRGMLWRRDDTGEWNAIPIPTNMDIRQVDYNWFLEVSPRDADEIYVGAIHAYRGNLIGSKWDWTNISTKKDGDDIHPDQHCIAIDPKNTKHIYVGNDGGVFFSPDKGMIWKSLNKGLGITEVQYLAQDLNDKNWLLAGTQDNGTIRYLGKEQWEQVSDGDGGDCGVNHMSPEVCYSTTFGMGMYRSIQKADPVKGNWRDIGPYVKYNDDDNFYPPLDVNGDVVAQAGYKVFISRNRGTKWKSIPLPGKNEGSAMHIPITDAVYVGTISGGIFKITWKGNAWSKPKALKRPRPGAYISDMYVDPKKLKRIWLTFLTLGKGRCFRSDDGGLSWKDCTPVKLELPISCIEVDPKNSKRVWIGADAGVYQSLNAGRTWEPLDNGLPNAMACDLLFNPKAKLLRVGLKNRGVWEIKV